MTPEFAHNGLHGLLVLLQQPVQLPVLLQEGVIFNYYLSILAFEFRLKDLYANIPLARPRRLS